jgi:hypothetical protein
MPKLAVFAACNKILIDKDSESPSLIGVFSAIKAARQGGTAIPENAVSPQEWAIFTMWRSEEGEVGTIFTQQVRIIAPNGVEYGKATDDFGFTGPSHTLRIGVAGMPVGKEGELLISLWLEKQGQRIAPHEYTYSVNIAHKAVKNA